MRLSIQTELKESKQKLLSFLLRQGKKYEESGYWTIKHKNWLAKLEFENKLLKEIFNEYMISVNTNEQRLKTIENRLKEIAQEKVVKEKVDKLVCFSGIETLTAVTIVSTVGDFNRFSSAYHFSKYLGLTCKEDSSGGRERRLGITKSGSKNLRRLLVESAKSIKKTNLKGKKSRRLLERQQGKDPLVVAYADKCRYRIRHKIAHLELRGKSANVATTAAARELACFIWGMMTNNIA